ncbi:MAG: putative tRNA pseudouridine synthase D [Methanoregula sp. PtaU1.Bin051]|nr:MAG: putative tRNA pseudouridine synthase D [Methanoregula sp. PtaU1.Bin051]
MRQSPYPLEHDLGMRCYASDAEGIGGKLRTVAEDFVVEEIPLPAPAGSGPYLICRLTKKNWEHQHAIKEIAKKMGISHRRIGWAGTKDRRAVTTQYISIYKVNREAVEHVRLKDITLEPVREQNAPLALGDLTGNRFSLIIRDCTGSSLATTVKRTVTDTATGIPNYYGLQRFGGIRPVTHRVGEYILLGDYKGAVLTYIGRAYPQEPEEIRKIRQIFYEKRDPALALAALPIAMGFERAMLQHLYNRPDDYAGALGELPPKLLSMFVSAFQSYLFNEALSARLESGLSLTEAAPGDRLIFANGRKDIVTAATLGTAARLIERERCGIAIFMPGREPYTPSSESECRIAEILEERGVGPENFSKASAFVRTAFDGALRPVALKTYVTADVEVTNVRLSFTLPPGHYATTVAREFMKTDPLYMI